MRYLILLFIIWSQFGKSQTILVESMHPATSPFCEDIVFKYHIESFSVNILSNVVLTLDLPEKVEYVAGSSQMMTELDVSDLNQPKFIVNDLMPLSISEISFHLKVGCDIYSEVQEGKEFQNELDFTHQDFEFLYTSDTYTFNPSLLVITSFKDQNEITNTSFSRFISIQNGRLGRTDKFIFSDFHDEVEMTTNVGTILEQTDSTLYVEFDSNDFKMIGNLDGYFDLDEEMVIEELIVHQDCEPEIISSEIQISWGCDSQMCQIDTAYADINLSPITGQARLRTAGYGQFPECPCLPDGYRQCIYIKNFGNASTQDLKVVIDITNKNSDVLGGVENSIRIDSGNATVLEIFYDTLRSLSCPSMGGVFGSAVVSLSDLEPDQEIILCYNLLPCFEFYPANGKNVEFRWSYGYIHETKCKPFSEQKRTGVEVRLVEEGVEFEHLVLGIEEDEDWISGGVYQLKWNVKSPNLLDTGRIEFYTCLPCGISPLDTIQLFNGEELISQTNEVTDSFARISSIYRLPFKSDSVSASLSVTSDCAAECIRNLGVPQNIRFITSCDDPVKVESDYSALICSGIVLSKCPEGLDCGFISEGFVSVGLECKEYDQEDTIYAYVETEASISRVSLGQEDNDDDRFTTGGDANPASVQLLRGVINDTFVANYKGSIVVEHPLSFLDSLDFALVSNLPLEFIRAEVGFKDAETSESWYCEFDAASFLKKDGFGPGCCQTVVQKNGENAIHIELNADIVSRICDVPSFELTSGDSVFCKMWVRNPIHVPLPVANSVVQYISAYHIDMVPLKEFSCGPVGTRLVYSGVVLDIFPFDEIEVDVCGDNSLKGGWKFNCLESMDNFFNREFRNFIKFDALSFEVPEEFSVDSVKITVNYRKDLIDTDTVEFILSAQFLDNFYKVDSLALERIVFDEGAHYYIQPFLKLKDCSKGPLDDAPKIYLNAKISGVDGFEFALVPLINSPFGSISPRLGREIHIDYPVVEFEAGGSVIDASDKRVCRVIQMEMSESVEILEWSARLVEDDLAEFELFEKSGLHLNKIGNGDYVGLNVEKGVYEFEYCFVTNSCAEDTLLINMNWSCETAGQGEVCYDSTFVFEIRKYDAELEMDLQADVKDVELCDTTSWWYIDVFNGDIGSAYDVWLTFALPEGLTLFESGIQYEYPVNSGWKPMPFPTLVSPLKYRWDISSLLGTDGDQLPGVNDLPKNRIQVRMKLVTSCELEQRSSVNFSVAGKNPCGSRTNLVAKSTAPIEIKDVANSFQTNVQMNLEHSSCEEKILMHFKATSNLKTAGGELIEISLPENLNYVGSSMINNQNIALQVPSSRQEFGRTVLTFISDFSVPANESISFSFIVSSWRDLHCIEDNVIGVFKTRRTAFCKNLGMPCETYIINGQNEELLQREDINVQIDTAKQVDSSGTKFLKIWVSGKSDSTMLGLLFRLYQDVNMNSTLDEQDEWLRSDSFDVIDLMSSNPYCLVVENSRLCSWLVEVGGPCFCNTDTLYVETNENVITQLCDTICTGDSLYIGKADLVPGSFTWISNEEVCDTCSVQWVIGENNVDTMTSRTYSLQLNTPEGCRETYIYTVKTYPADGPFYDTLEICPGDTVLLEVKTTADWIGPDIGDVRGTGIRVAPQSESTYTATYINDDQCVVVHDFVVVVIPVSHYTLDSSFVITKGDSIQLTIDPRPDSVMWSPSEGLSCVRCPDPWAKPDSTTTYKVLIFDSSGCTRILKVIIEVAPPPCDESSIYLPNVFSPNGDNINDIWRLRSNVVDMVEIVVYNRWGEQVFASSDPDFQWDGTFEGEYLKPDVFAYHAQFRCFNGESLVLKGNLSLIR